MKLYIYIADYREKEQREVKAFTSYEEARKEFDEKKKSLRENMTDKAEWLEEGDYYFFHDDKQDITYDLDIYEREVSICL